MPYQPYQSTWLNPYVQQTSYPQYLPVQPSQTQAYPQPVNGIVKVNGPESARQYYLPPNSMSPALFDNDGKRFYVVSTDGTGAKTVEAFDFTPHVEEPLVIDNAQFVSREEFDEFAAKVNAVIGATDGPNGPVHASAPGAGAAQQDYDRQGDGRWQPQAPVRPDGEDQPTVRAVRCAERW